MYKYEIIIYWDFVNQLVSTWYDGSLVDNQMPFNSGSSAAFSDLNLVPGGQDGDVYLDGLDIGYELQ